MKAMWGDDVTGKIEPEEAVGKLVQKVQILETLETLTTFRFDREQTSCGEREVRTRICFGDDTYIEIRASSMGS